jgi:hypothetical protein
MSADKTQMNSALSSKSCISFKEHFNVWFAELAQTLATQQKQRDARQEMQMQWKSV